MRESNEASGRPRSPGVAYAVIALALLILVGVMALTQRQPPPPTIAEFAPQSVDNITDAPSDQSSSSGSGQGECLGGPCGAGAGGATPVPPAPIDIPRVRRCVGDPPRQIEDPQSPPCVPYWSGNNGGATTRGVTRDEVVVAAQTQDSTPETATRTRGQRVLEALAAFFNKRFEFYGRRITIAHHDPAKAGQTCPGRKAGVTSIVEERKAFAMLAPSRDNEACFIDEAARQGLVTVAAGMPTERLSEANAAPGDPYVWQYLPTTDEMLAHWGRWTCRRLAGSAASHATDLTYRSNPRTFALLYQGQSVQTPYRVDTGPLEQELAACGERLVVKEICYGGECSGDKATNAIVKMHSEGVTTVLCACPIVAAASVPSKASSQGYFPEWVLHDGLTRSFFVKQFWPDSAQRQSLMGFGTAPVQVPYASYPMNWALSEAEPGFQINAGSNQVDANLQNYWTMLLLASGIQMAGPHLTAETFRDALHRTQFPNPSTPPLQEGWVGFPQGRHGMIHDAVAMWWSEAAQSPYPEEGAGTWCYAEGARRYKIDEWTKGPDALFAEVCDTHPPGLR